VTTDRRIGDGGRVLAIAHRGDPVAFRENTIESIEAAVRAGADLVEIDVKTTGDGVSVVLHDDTLTRLWGDDRDIRDVPVADLPAPGPGQGVPTLAEVLTTIGRSSAGLLVDMDSGEWAPAALHAVSASCADGRVRAAQVLWCGHRDGLRRVRAADPDARIVLTWDAQAQGGPPSDKLLEELRPEAFNPHWRGLLAGGRDWARGKGLPLCCWTVDDRALMRSLVEKGVDAIISNRIGVLVEVVQAAAVGARPGAVGTGPGAVGTGPGGGGGG